MTRWFWRIVGAYFVCLAVTMLVATFTGSPFWAAAMAVLAVVGAAPRLLLAGVIIISLTL